MQKRVEIAEVVDVVRDGTFKKAVRTFLVIILILVINSLYAQSKFIGGAKLGVNSSQVSGDNLSGFKHFGFTGGLSVKKKFTDILSYKIELLYSQKGSRKTSNPEKLDYTFYQLNLDYVEIPVMLEFKQKNKYNFVIEAGASIGVLAIAKEENEYGDIASPRPFYNKEISVILGVNYPCNDKFFVNWRLTNSVLPIRDHLSDAVFRFNRGQYNTVMAFSVNYLFNNAG